MLNYDKQQYAIQQVCENGHKITGCYKVDKLADMLNINEKPKEFCQDCGAATIIDCPSCGNEIQGDKLKVNYGTSDVVKSSIVPSYCVKCGKPYPWTEKMIIAAIQVFAELGVQESTIDEDMHNIAKDIPQATPSAIRIERICKKLGPLAYNVVMEFATKTTTEILKGNMP